MHQVKYPMLLGEMIWIMGRREWRNNIWARLGASHYFLLGASFYSLRLIVIWPVSIGVRSKFKSYVGDEGVEKTMMWIRRWYRTMMWRRRWFGRECGYSTITSKVNFLVQNIWPWDEGRWASSVGDESVQCVRGKVLEKGPDIFKTLFSKWPIKWRKGAHAISYFKIDSSLNTPSTHLFNLG